jgi:type II secretory ATPase GspE/PulE/Tfp pilus assembly ATPase PilB-like protein
MQSSPPLPASLNGHVMVCEGIVHVSEEVRRTPELLSFLSYCSRRGISEQKIVNPAQFQKLRVARGQARTESDVQALAVELIRTAHALGASDIHVEDHGPFVSVDLRILTMVQRHRVLMGDEGRALIRCIYQTMSASAEAQYSPGKRQDGRIISRNYLPPGLHSIRLHTEPLECAISDQGIGTFLAMRLLYDSTHAKGALSSRLTALGYSARHVARLEFLTQRSGLTLLSGPTGSGKSTALKHIMECMALDNPEKSFLSIEDPPEFPLEGVKQVRVLTDGDLDRGTEYRRAIAGAMRSDPDTLMLGEIRYPEAAMAAVDAAQTGHGVWTTIHANSAIGIVQRMLSLLNSARCPAPAEYLCDHTVLAGLLHQRLIPLLCPSCKIPFQEIMRRREDDAFRNSRLPRHVAARVFRTVDPARMAQVCVRGEGCTACNSQGFSGLAVVAEVIATDRTILSHLRHGEIEAAIRHWRHEQNGLSFVEHAVSRIEEGVADPRITEQRLGVPLNFAQAIEDDLLTGNELDQLASGSMK